MAMVRKEINEYSLKKDVICGAGACESFIDDVVLPLATIKTDLADE